MLTNTTYSLIGTLIASMTTVLGVLPVLFIKKISKKTECLLLSFSTGIMLSAAFFTLLTPGLESASKMLSSNFKIFACLLVVISFLSGAIFIFTIDRYLYDSPLDCFKHGKEKTLEFSKCLWLFMITIMIHNFPEGMVVGIGFGSGNSSYALPLAIGIGLQNIPEGLIVAISAIALGFNRKRSFLLVLISALLEFLGGVLGIFLVSFSEYLLPFGFGFSAGAMLYVILQKMIPELYCLGYKTTSTVGCLLGLMLMMSIDFLL